MKVDGAAQLDVFRGYLRDHNLPVTQQREAVAAVLFYAVEHLSVDDIERALRDEETHVGKATIYRTLDLMLRSGLIKEHDFGEGFKRYEPITARTQHGHMICLSCGKVEEFLHDRLDRMVALIAEERAFQHQSHRLEIHGYCRDCEARGMATVMTPNLPLREASSRD